LALDPKASGQQQALEQTFRLFGGQTLAPQLLLDCLAALLRAFICLAINEKPRKQLVNE